MPGTKLEVVRYQPELRNAIARLQTHLWSTDQEANARYFAWKYEQNPYLDEPIAYVAMLDGMAVGMRGMLGSRWEYGPGREIFAPLIADDMVVAPEHANRRVVSQIMTTAFRDLAARGHSHVLNLSGGVVTVLGSLAMGWKSAGTLVPVSLESGEARRRRRLRERVARMRFLWRYSQHPALFSAGERNPFARLDRRARAGCIPRPVRVESRSRPAEMAALVESLGHDGRLRHMRDQAYFAWRYRNPLHEYRFLFWGDPEPGGYLVLQRSVSDLANRRRVRIVDVEARDATIRAGLLRCAVSAGCFPELFTWTGTASVELKGMLRAEGFEPADTVRMAKGVPCLLIRPLRDAPRARDWEVGTLDLLHLGNWDVRLADSMQG